MTAVSNGDLPDGHADVEDRIEVLDGSQVQTFDKYEVGERCKELMRRISMMPGTSNSPPWKWDILELMEESHDQLHEIRKGHSDPNRGMWQEISSTLASEHTASTLPVSLRKQCEEIVSRRIMWLGDFDTELHAILARGSEIRERLLFEDVDRAGWFSATGVSALEVQRLLERHAEMHQRAARLARQLQLLSRGLQQQGTLSSRRRAFQAKTVGEKLQSSLVCLAAVAVAPVPGSSEMWLATTTMMWLDKDQAWQHVVYEHPRDADTDTILDQFQCRSNRARSALAAWKAMPAERRRGCVLVHNASVRRIIVKPKLVNHISGASDGGGDWTQALDHHPLGNVMKKALTLGMAKTEDVVEGQNIIAPQRLAVVQLPPKPDTNWGWRGHFAYGDTKVGDCAFREGGVFSFISVDCGLRVGDREEAAAEAAEMDGEEPKTSVEIVNRTDEPVQVKVFEPGHHASRLFKSAMAEGVISPSDARTFVLKASKGSDTDLDVEVRIGNKKAKCEVVGDQVIFVEGLMGDN
eukprot:TRINITY_DN40020_c0_g1_i1.p1 TRINITY_DN40020_c0_g1~~TRINITY_DN40020_c0_g1_i1.p1  ORF type:complete len:523 (-),score=98.15 TRINITY_DN40020_c0_g1_i1:39-1607(-)